MFGIVIDGEAHAYPWDILIWHEIVNDEINGKPFSVTFCPLTGTGLLFNRSAISGSTIGVSGKLYENNLVFYDRESDTHWSQVLNLAIYGEKIGQKLKIEPIVETKWKVWKVLHPDTKVLSRSSSSELFQRLYNYNIYGDYRDTDTIWFKTAYNATLAPYDKYFPKALNLVIGTDTSKIKVYPFEELGKKSVLNEKQENKPFAIFFDKINQLVIPFDSTIDSTLTDETVLKFKLVNATEFDLNSSQTLSMPVFQDQTGTIWNMLGQAIYGTLEGEKLDQIPSFNAFWFAVTAFFPEATIYPTESNNTTGIDFLILLPINVAGITVYINRKRKE